MFGLPSFRIGRVFGIPIEVNASWFVIFVLVSASLATQYFPRTFTAAPLVYVAVSAFATVLFFASVVLHELSHSLVARRLGIPIQKVTLFLFGGVAQLERDPDSPAGEFAMALAGPAMSLVLAAMFFVTRLGLVAVNASPILTEPLGYLTVINLYVAVFNLLPGLPLDGGRVFRAAVWKLTGDFVRATRWASRAGQVLGYGMVSLGLLGVILGNFSLVWFVVLGWFLARLAETSYRRVLTTSRVQTLVAGDIMSTPVVVAPGEITVDRLVEEFFLGGRHSKYPVASGTNLVGLVTLARVGAIPREAWSSTLAADAADTDVARLIVPDGMRAEALIERLGSGNDSALLVTRDGQLAGIITRSDVLRALRTFSQP